MNKKIVFLITTGVILFTACKKEEANPSDTTTPLNAGYTSRLNKVLDSVAIVQNLKGVTAVVYIPNKGIWKKAFGQSHSGVNITTDMQLPVGSSTKTYVAALMLKLQELGMLNLNDTIGKWIKNVPNVNGSITIKQCLNHTSGLFNYVANTDFNNAVLGNLSKIWRPEELLQFVEAPYFAPGDGWEYSNTGYIVAGMIVSKVTNMTAKDALRKYILSPLGFTNTVFFPDEPATRPFPHFWTMEFSTSGQLEDLNTIPGYSTASINSTASTAGAIVATAEENALFYNALMKGKIINPASLAEMKDVVVAGNLGVKYGLGLFLMEQVFNGRTVFNHGGLITGSNCYNLYDTSSGVCISIIMNQEPVVGNEGVILVQALHKETL